MELISEEEYMERVEPALMQVFNDSIFPLFGAVKCPFTDSIEGRAFLYGYSDNPFSQSITFWHALIKAIIENGDTEIFKIDTMGGFCRRYNSLADMDDISLIKLYGAYQVFCSLQGNWGLLFDVDGLCLVGGSKVFIETIREGFPEIDQQIYYLFERYIGHTEYGKIGTLNISDTETIDWFPNILIHVFGEVRGKELLSEARNLGIYD